MLTLFATSSSASRWRKRLHALPEKIKLARAALAVEEQRLANYIGFACRSRPAGIAASGRFQITRRHLA